jgi:hypothetical protein
MKEVFFMLITKKRLSLKKIVNDLKKWREKKPNRYEKTMEKLKVCDSGKLRFYKFSNTFRAPVEALVTLYLVTFVIIFKDGILCSNPPNSTLIRMILVSFGIALAVCAAYTMAVIIGVNLWSSYVVKHKDGKCKSYMKVHKSFSRIMLGVHLVGWLCYIGVSLWIARLYSYFELSVVYGVPLDTYLALWGTAFGFLWNVNGFFSDMRIDWGVIFNFLDNKSIKKDKEIGKMKLKYYQLTKLSHFAIVGILISFFIHIVVFNFRTCSIASVDICETLSETDSISNVFSYSVFFTLLLSIAMLYAGYTYKIFYSRYYKESSKIFPLPEDFVERGE